MIRRLKDIAKTQYVMSYYVASIYAALGDKEAAFAELETSFAECDWELYRLKVDPVDGSFARRPAIQGNTETAESAGMKLESSTLG